ncbi:MAG: acyl-[acyl-carrier-protein]--UDP-N-acetylglucosamine O-acyltransferase, partial [Smithellaceae bacterium]
MNIHSTAIVAPDAELGEGVEIGPYSIIGKEVKIGR